MNWLATQSYVVIAPGKQFRSAGHLASTSTVNFSNTTERMRFEEIEM
jgi:hypothetical protein